MKLNEKKIRKALITLYAPIKALDVLEDAEAVKAAAKEYTAVLTSYFAEVDMLDNNPMRLASLMFSSITHLPSSIAIVGGLVGTHFIESMAHFLNDFENSKFPLMGVLEEELGVKRDELKAAIENQKDEEEDVN